MSQVYATLVLGRHVGFRVRRVAWASLIAAGDDPQPDSPGLPNLRFAGVETEGEAMLPGDAGRLALSAESPEPLTVASYVSQDVLAATDDEHKPMTAAVEFMRRYGVSAINIDLRFVTVPERVMTKMIKDWELIPVDLGDEVPGFPRSHLHEVIDRPWPAGDARPSAKPGVNSDVGLHGQIIIRSKESEPAYPTC